MVHPRVGLTLERFLAQGRDYRPSALDAKEFAAAVKNLSPKRSAVRLVVACQLADDSLDPVHLVADEPSAALGVRQSLEVVVFVQLLDP